jgi:outer membrane biosynthesis protein TonB
MPPTFREDDMRRTTAAGLGLVMAMACAGPAAAADKKPPAPRQPKPPPAAKAPAPVPVAAAAAPTPTLDADHRSFLDKAFKSYVAPRFTVLASDVLDDDTRAAAEAMQAEHLPRVRALMEQWTLEEMQQPHPQRALHRTMARLANEFALWGRDSTGPAQDAALAQALQVSGMCRPVGPRASELVMRLARLRVLPPDVRRAAVQAERELLARWGRPRPVDDSEPLPAEDALLRLRATGQPPATPLPPVLAQLYLGDDDATRQDPLVADPMVRCALHQWAGATPAQFRAAMAMQAADVVWANRREAAGRTEDDDPYPRLATQFGIRGLVTLHAELNPQGQLLRVRVAKRDIKVPGVRGARPFAHEGVLDLATIAKAQAMDWSAFAPKEGLRKVEREFQWSLSWE